MAALKEGSGTVPWGYAKLRGEQQEDLADITSSGDLKFFKIATNNHHDYAFYLGNILYTDIC
jgi:hypothetical protein